MRLNRTWPWALTALLLLLLALDGLVFIASSNKVNHIRGDFCAWEAAVYHATRQLPQVPARIQAEHADLQLEIRLGC